MSERSLLKRQMKRVFRALGYDLVRYQPSSHPEAKRAAQIQSRRIDTVLDVGANTGQYVTNLRDLGYQGAVISFEPLSSAYKVLEKHTAADPAWQAFNYALGAEEGKLDINISENSWSSSLLDMKESHVSAVPESRYVASEQIHVKRLDSLFGELCPEGSKVFLKIDTQGYEKQVLAGALDSLSRIDMIQLEMSFAPLYEGQALFVDIYTWLCEHGFQISSVEGEWWDRKTGELMQIDGVFQRI